jgi:iron complex outermembrane receptor protein
MTAAPGKLEIQVASVALRGSARGLRNRYRVGATPTAQEQVTVSATRNHQRLDDIPTRVEVLDREDIEERMLMTPGRHRDAT